MKAVVLQQNTILILFVANPRAGTIGDTRGKPDLMQMEPDFQSKWGLEKFEQPFVLFYAYLFQTMA